MSPIKKVRRIDKINRGPSLLQNPAHKLGGELDVNCEESEREGRVSDLADFGWVWILCLREKMQQGLSAMRSPITEIKVGPGP